MCLALVALDAHPKYRCVIAANRDELPAARAAEPAHWWDEDVLAGPRPRRRRQLVRRHANRPLGADHQLSREAYLATPTRPRVASWCMRMLREAASPLRSSAALLPDGGRYHGFNLLVGDDSDVAFASNRCQRCALARRRRPRLVESPARHLMAEAAAQQGAPRPHGSPTTTRRSRPRSRCFLPIASPQADANLPPRPAFRRSGKACSRRRSSSSPEYGTRSSTVLLIARDDSARFIERSFDAGGRATGEVAFDFRVDSAG